MPITHGHGNPAWIWDETVLALDLALKTHPKTPDPDSLEVIALSNLLRSAKFHPSEERTPQFRNPVGVHMKMIQLLSMHDDNSSKKGLRPTKTDRQVWEALGGDMKRLRLLVLSIRTAIEQLGLSSQLMGVDEEEELPEGRVLTSLHKKRERAPGLRRKLVARVRENHGTIQCETCRAKPRIASLGNKMEEVEFDAHHIVPLSLLNETKTKLKDLVLLCVSCHRLIHALSRREGRSLLVDEFLVLLRAAGTEASTK